jgi:hypothetical protein
MTFVLCLLLLFENLIARGRFGHLYVYTLSDENWFHQSTNKRISFNILSQNGDKSLGIEIHSHYWQQVPCMMQSAGHC